MKVHKVYKVHKVRKVHNTGVLRTIFISSNAAVGEAPRKGQ